MDRPITPTVQPLEPQVSRRYTRATPVIAPGLTATMTVSLANEPSPVLSYLRSKAPAIAETRSSAGEVPRRSTMSPSEYRP